MLRSKTVFVVGAGASHEVKLPIGATLRRTIYDKLDFRPIEFVHGEPRHGDKGIYRWLRTHYPKDANNYLNACGRIRNGVLLSASIDDFLDVHRDDKEMVESGKVVIAQAILEAEQKSLLSYDTGNIYNTIDFSQVEETWYMGFFRLLSEGLSKAQRAEIFKNAAVVCFNYDRCIEHFLVHVLAAHYYIERDEARELASHLPIYRPYGSVGTLQDIAFGMSDIRNAHQVTKSIRTYTEQITDEVSLGRIRDAVREARVIIFLGNAFHANNMKLVIPNDMSNDQRGKDIYFTRIGISDSDLPMVMRRLRALYHEANYEPTPHHWFRYTDTCHKLFQEYRLSLRQ